MMIDILQPPRSPVSSLLGMERPVRSFKSFVKNTPPPSKSQYHKHKPLPLTPIYGRSIFAMSSSSLPTTSDQSASANFWEAPTAWDDPSTPHHKLQAPTPYCTRSYAPLIPEPSPGVSDRHEPPWISHMNSSQHPSLDRINERAHIIPALPSRSPFRLSAFCTLSTESEPGVPILTPKFYNMNPQSTMGTPSSCPELVHSYSHDSYMPQSNVQLRISNLSTKQKAFAALGIESSEENENWDNWSGGPGTPQFRDDVRTPLSIQDQVPHPSKLEYLVLDEESDLKDMSEKLRQLCVSQDYHNILADQYHEADALEQLLPNDDNIGQLPSNHAICPEPHNSIDLIPRPLSWSKKAYNSFSTGNTTPEMRANPVSPSKSGPRHRRRSSWMPIHQITHVFKRPSLAETHSRSSGDIAASAHRRGSSQYLNPMSYLKSLGFTPKGTNSSRAGSRPIPFQPTSPPSSLQAEGPKPSLRPPGGLTIVPHSLASGWTPRMNTMRYLNMPPTEYLDAPWSNSRPNFLNHGPNPTNYGPNSTDWRRSSVYGQAIVAPAVAIKKTMRKSVGSISSTRNVSNSSSPPTSPLAHEISFPRTPPPLPAYAPRVLELTSPQSPASYGSAEKPFGSRPVIKKFSKRPKETGIIEKAKGARKAWRRRQKEVKHEKLKASIRVLGPVGDTISDGFAMRVNWGLLHNGVDGSIMPGYVANGAAF